MGHSHHRVQHRPRKESREIELKTEVSQLRSDNMKLRRENGRLRREVDKLNAHLDSFDEFAEDIIPPLEVKPLVAPLVCENRCQGELKRLVLPHKVLLVCPECKTRRTE